VEPTLAVIGLSYRTSPVAVRERFWIGASGRYEALHHLLRSEGIDEAIVLATCNRTEFILWANDVPAAANSVLRLLTHDYQLKLCDWSHFYRLMDDVAFTHIFQVAAGLDSAVVGEPEISNQMREAWQQARSVGATGRFLDAVIHKTLAVSARVRKETSIGDSRLTFPSAAVELAIGVLGDLAGSEVLLLGAGRMSEVAGKCLRKAGAGRLKVINRTQSKADELAYKLGAKSVAWDDRLAQLKTADVVVCTTSSPSNMIGFEEAKAVARARQQKPIVVIDIAVPRNVDPRAGEIDGVFLFDMDGLEEVIRRDPTLQHTATDAANKIVAEEVQGFRRRLSAERAVPTIVALRRRLEDLCQQEVDFLRQEFGPFTEEQDDILTTLAAHITQRIASSLARELREPPDRTGQDVLTVAVQRLFRLEKPGLVETGQENCQ
jgi:glutamyl-tRNA reductase